MPTSRARRSPPALSLWNDVSALSHDDNSIETAASLDCDIVLMHAQGDPRTMQDDPVYEDVVTEVLAFLAGRIELAVAAGIDRTRIIADPGIGFGKALEHNLALLAGLARFRALDAAILLGASRKRFIAALDRPGPASQTGWAGLSPPCSPDMPAARGFSGSMTSRKRGKP